MLNLFPSFLHTICRRYIYSIPLVESLFFSFLFSLHFIRTKRKFKENCWVLCLSCKFFHGRVICRSRSMYSMVYHIQRYHFQCWDDGNIKIYIPYRWIAQEYSFKMTHVFTYTINKKTVSFFFSILFFTFQI